MVNIFLLFSCKLMCTECDDDNRQFGADITTKSTKKRRHRYMSSRLRALRSALQCNYNISYQIKYPYKHFNIVSHLTLTTQFKFRQNLQHSL